MQVVGRKELYMPQGRIGVVSKSPERWEIWIGKKKAGLLPFREHIRVQVKLKIGNDSYDAGLRSKPNVYYVWICPDLIDTRGKKISLLEALKKAGFDRKEEVELQVDDHVIAIKKIPIRDIHEEICSTRRSTLSIEQQPNSKIEELWHSQNEAIWHERLDRYWDFVKPDNLEIEKELNVLDIGYVQDLDEREWYNFLLHEYFKSKYTAPNRYATTTKKLKWYIENDALSVLYQIKQDLLAFDLRDIEKGLNIANRIRGLGIAGASGLLSILFPKYFGTVDQFVVKALRSINDLPDLNRLNKMNPEGLSVADGLILIRIMRDKAAQNNQHFSTDFWTPRKIDMILWTYGRKQ